MLVRDEDASVFLVTNDKQNASQQYYDDDDGRAKTIKTKPFS